MKKYKAQGYIFARIDEVNVERETASSVWIGGRRYLKISGYESFFDTWEEAHIYLVGEAQNKVDLARRVLDKKCSELEKLRSMEKPKGVV